jgi:NADH:ubiquinone oxidoreductase subunit H
MSMFIICVVVMVVLVVAYLSKMQDMLVICIIVVLACIAFMSAVYFCLKFVVVVERQLVGVVEKRGKCGSKQVAPE